MACAPAAMIDPDPISAFECISLCELDERAGLLRRVDNKYALAEDDFQQLLRRLRSGHQVLEIDGRHVFRYSTTYFETSELRCLIDHIEDRAPRFKVRSRFYEDSGDCVFEVKLKRTDGETDKRQIGYAPEDRRRMTDEAWDCLRSALGRVGIETPRELSAKLTTEFERLTLASRSGSERLTCDFGVRMTGSEGATAKMRADLVLVETKTESGTSPADRELERLGARPISLSKYRVGMSLVGGADRFGAQPGSEFFERQRVS